MEGFFRQLSQQASFHQSDSFSDELLEFPDVFTADGDDTQGDPMQDDYVFIEERIVTKHNQHTRDSDLPPPYSYPPLHPDAPPTYKQVFVNEEPPSYESVILGSCTVLSKPHGLNPDVLPAQSGVKKLSHGHVSPISDIPFNLNPALEIQHLATSLLVGLNLKPEGVDLTNTAHDFTREQMCLGDISRKENS